MHEIKIIKNTEEWEEFVLRQEFSPFVQSYKYGEFYKIMGEEYWIFGLYSEGKMIGGSLVISTHARRGNFLYLPYGPFLEKNCESSEIFFDFLKKFALKNKYDFIRISPMIDDSEELRLCTKKIGFRNAPMHVLAENSWILDLEDSEEKILSNMKKNHRNLIRRCQKAGVKIEARTDKEALDLLNDMHDVTEKKHNFTRFSRHYIEKEFNVFSKDKESIVYLAYLPDGTLDASSIIVFYGKMAVYRHSASLNTDRKLPTSYLIQWEAIKEAKKRGMKWYNFWGVEPEDAPLDHPFHGITHFKKGFGGFQKDLLHCQDLPVSKKYWLNWIIETVRRKKRGF